MATSKKVTVAGVSSTALDSGTYTNYTWVESGTGIKAGANTFNINNSTTTAALTLTGISGDVVKVNGYSGDYSASFSKSTLTLQNNTQTIKVTLAKSSTVTLNFVDGKKVVDFTVSNKPKMDGVALTTKASHINGQTAHEAAALALAATDKATALATAAAEKATALAAAATDKATALAAAATDKATALATAATDKATALAAAETTAATDKANAVTAALTDTSGTNYANVNAAIVANDAAVTTAAINSALAGTAFTSIADLLTAYKAFAPSFSVTTNVSANEGSDAIALAGTGGAVSGTDFGTATGATLSGNVLTFASGQTTATVKVPLTADGIAETGEGLKLTLTGTTGSLIGANATTGSVTTSIVDASDTFYLSATSTSATGTIGNDKFNVAAGTYAADVINFAAGDKLNFFAGASITVLPDTDQADGIQVISAADSSTGATATITLKGLTAAQDAALFNSASVDSVFGAGTLLINSVSTPTGALVNLTSAAPTTTGTAAIDTFNIATGTYTATVNSFASGDKLRFFAGASLTVLPDSDQTDGIQQISAADTATGATTTVILTGLTSAQDGGVFNVTSFNTVFGAGSIA
jgi:hypothetical protein